MEDRKTVPLLHCGAVQSRMFLSHQCLVQALVPGERIHTMMRCGEMMRYIEYTHRVQYWVPQENHVTVTTSDFDIVRPCSIVAIRAHKRDDGVYEGNTHNCAKNAFRNGFSSLITDPLTAGLLVETLFSGTNVTLKNGSQVLENTYLVVTIPGAPLLVLFYGRLLNLGRLQGIGTCNGSLVFSTQQGEFICSSSANILAPA